MKTVAKTPEREALRAAIAAHQAATKNLADAQTAAIKARDHDWTARRKLDALREESEAPIDESFIANLSAGDFDAATLTKPAAALLAQIDALEAEVATWKHARDIAEQSIPIRQKALEWATWKLDDEVRATIAAESDIGALIKSAEEVQAATLAVRCKLSALLNALPHNSEQHAMVDNFLAKPWLLAQGNWVVHPASAPYREMFDALKTNADAPLPAA